MKFVAMARRRVKLSHDERMRRLRLGDLRKLFDDRCRGSILSDDDAGRDYLRELLLPISLGPNEAVKGSGAIAIWGPTDRMLREIELRAPWMSADEAQELLDEINLMPMWQRKPKARTLGERLNVPYAERARLRLQTIGPCDMTEAAMALLRKQKKRQRDRLRRQSNGARPRANSVARTKPWLALGVSRRTYYYRLKPARANCTNTRQVNLTLVEREPVQQVKRVVSEEASKICGRLPTPTPAGQTETCANDDLLPWDDYEWLDKQNAREGLIYAIG